MKKLLIIMLFSAISVFGVSVQKIGCPSQNFDQYIQVYTENITIQKAFANDPLEKLQLDLDAEPEPKPIIQKVNRKDIHFPLIMNEANRKKNQVTYTIEKINDKKMKLLLGKPDTDYQIIYFFNRNDSCWILERIEDWSL